MATCTRCGHDRALLDEHDRCEECVIALEHVAYQGLYDLEYLVDGWLASGLTGAQLHEVLDMILSDAEGAAASSPFRRRPVDTDEGGIWYVDPPSAFMETPASELGRCRASARLSREALAERLGVAVTDVALWENGAKPPAEIAQAIAEYFGVRSIFGHGEVA